MPLFDFKCDCGFKCELFINLSEIDDIYICPECNKEMVRQFPDSMDFELKYDPKKDRCGWSYDGYSTTQRYRETDKMAKHNIFDQGRIKK